METTSSRIKILIVASLAISLLIFLTTGQNKIVGGRTFSTKALHGKQVWLNNQCGSCHSIYGLGGHLGPDLTNVAGRRGEAYIRWILNSGKNMMPRFSFKNEETNGLLAYFEGLQHSGIYPLPSLWQEPYGQTNNSADKVSK